jgi:hypothetical protein
MAAIAFAVYLRDRFLAGRPIHASPGCRALWTLPRGVQLQDLAVCG